ncbi:uncharacterized protein K02A2.6-like [Uranotaenia lowii]|uniref:uncharacterized protein K02A2.6-like n=1 Tax=Uranotaenia lowii TaxID=190385 RepID=UPI002479AE7E|nr:uncharacterized protein K02A2.6-like [Uranotaenia lowii]
MASHIKDESWNEESEVFIRRNMVQTLSLLSNIESSTEENLDNGTEIVIRAIQESVAMDITEVKKATENDGELQSVQSAITQSDWKNEKVKAYAPFQDELSYANNLLMRGSKLVIPTALRNRMLSLAHEGHPGQSSMKRRLRDRCWWPNIDKDVVMWCEKCEGCRLIQIPGPPEPMHRRPLPSKPWVDIALDYLGPMPTGEYILVVVDYYSRYVEIEIMTVITARETIKRLEKMFKYWGLPQTITLDNAKQFISSEFHEFCNNTKIHLNHTTPYWPQANGEVERQNRSLLKRMKIANALYGDWKSELQQYLQMFNNTPHTVTGKAPSELLQNRKLRYKLPDIGDIETSPPSTDFADRDRFQKFKGKESEDLRRRSKTNSLEKGDIVLMKDLHPQNKLSTNFLKEKFEVEERKGSNVQVKSLETGNAIEMNR